MQTPDNKQDTENAPRSEAEKRADSMCNAIERISYTDEGVEELVWQYFRDNQDHLAFMLLQAAHLDHIAGYLEEIQMSIDHLTDDNGNLSVLSYEQNS